MTNNRDGKKLTPLQNSMVSFTSGAAFGLTSVLVGQPFDVCKTRMQTMNTKGIVSTARVLFQKEGIRGLFRGGVPMWLGGALFRSAQFGCYETALSYLGGAGKERVFFGILDPAVVAAGFVGGLGRGVVESPFEYVKVRRQVEGDWKLRDVYRGSSVTLVRNAFLFTFFMINIDLSKRYIPGGLSPFWTGAICATGAWLMIWPLDVLKSQRQSGFFEGVPTSKLLYDIVRTGALFRGVVPGLIRSVFANGTSMYVYNQVQDALTKFIVGTS